MSHLSENTISEVQSNLNSQRLTSGAQPKWFAVRISYSRELALKAILDREKMENFIPMRYETVMKEGKCVRKLVPAIHNLVFVHSTRKRIDALKNELETSMPIRFIMNREHCRPVIIPDDQMHSFILVSGSYDEAVFYIESAELHLVKGQKVRITGGVFEGVVGEFVRIRHDRRVVVNIEGVMAVATTFIPPSMVEPVGDDPLPTGSNSAL
jgi:transcription antitermination factor NusG